MRPILALAFLVVTGLSAVTYRDVMLRNTRAVPAVRRPRAVAVRTVAVAVLPANPLTPDSLAVVDDLIGKFMTALQGDRDNTAFMRDLAHLYMRHGWFDRALGPLARALEIDPQNAELQRFLTLALARSGTAHRDLARARAEFLEAVEMWGHAC